MTLEGLIATYGYAAVGIGTFLEGETILVLAAFAASRGYLELPWVIVWAFLGTFFGDQLYFHIGRSKGQQFLQKRPSWQARSGKVFAWLERHPIGLILGFRFLYGLRTVTPFIIGASRVSTAQFLVLNLIGSVVWAIVFGVLGYVFGYTLELLLGDIKKFEVIGFVALGSIATVAWLTRWFIKLRK
ncbi:DedA family protein [Marinobacteraceae bacterium S3BR75-40.1]